ncbi:MAG: ATP-binding cassette domain-containing protein, partial [Acidimicrobiia bacterium]
MIRFSNVTFTYPAAQVPALLDVELDVDEGSLCLVTGLTGAGKSTLLAAVNGLVPRFSGGTLRGSVTVAGRDTSRNRLREMADLVGWVAQEPRRGFVTETVEDELAYTMEQLGLEPQAMRKRVEETLDLLGLAPLRNRRLQGLSAGEAQRVAIGAVLTAHPRVLVLDEPTSALDPTAAEEVLAAVVRLVHDVGLTVLMAEHRLERVIHYADEIAFVTARGEVCQGPPARMMETSPVAPPVVELARLVGWSPPPLSVRDARRVAPDLRDRLRPASRPPSAGAAILASVRGLNVVHDQVVAVRDVDLDLEAGTITAVMGRNGAGKSSLLWAMQGSGRRRGGSVEVLGDDPARLAPAQARRRVTLVPQDPADLLYLDSVDDECRQADAQAGVTSGTCAALAGRLVPDLDYHSHPADLSEGEKLGLVLAIQLTSSPPVVLLDEPTRGLDYNAKKRLTRLLRELAEGGSAVAVATHDVEFVADTAQRVVVLAEGEVVARGETETVLTASPAFAPQVAKIMAPGHYLTVADVAAS